MTTRASLSNVVQNDHLARHKEEHASSLANLSQSLESAWTLSKEELTELMLGEREAREILEEAVVAVGQETRNLKENFPRSYLARSDYLRLRCEEALPSDQPTASPWTD